MTCKPETEIKEKMKNVGLTMKNLSILTETSYSKMNSNLNGFTKLSDELKCKIEEVLSDLENPLKIEK